VVLLTPLEMAVTDTAAPSTGSESGPVTRPRMMSGSWAPAGVAVNAAASTNAAAVANRRSEDKCFVTQGVGIRIPKLGRGAGPDNGPRCETV
jgi:hypothetical protein